MEQQNFRSADQSHPLIFFKTCYAWISRVNILQVVQLKVKVRQLLLVAKDKTEN